jgi:hypothetical protein
MWSQQQSAWKPVSGGDSSWVTYCSVGRTGHEQWGESASRESGKKCKVMLVCGLLLGEKGVGGAVGRSQDSVASAESFGQPSEEKVG